MYVILLVLLSFVYAWIPYIHNNHGLAGAWCWVRTMDDNCTVVGLVDQVMTGYVIYVTTGLFGGVMIIVIVIMYCKLPPTLREARLLLKKTIIILICLLLSTLLLLCLPSLCE